MIKLKITHKISIKPNFSRGRCFAEGSDSCSSLQVLFDLSCVLPIEPLCLLVELGISLINVVYVSIIIVGPAPAVLLALLNPGRQVAPMVNVGV